MIEAPGVAVHYAKGTAKWARLALELLPEANSNALHTLGMTTNRKVTIHLYATTQGFGEATNYTPPDTLGVARPRTNEIIIDCSLAKLSGNNSFNLTLKHEMIHIAFGRLNARTGHSVPLWFNEGVACWAMGRLRMGDPKLLVRAANTDTLIPLEHLAAAFPQTGIARELAYQQGESAVTFLLEAYGADSIRRIVARMDQGLNFDEALDELTGGTDFQSRWKQYVRHKYPFLAMIWNFFSLFTGLALFVIFAYAIYRVRRRRIRKRWKEEEQEETGFYY